jgi:hypothetical protein
MHRSRNRQATSRKRPRAAAAKPVHGAKNRPPLPGLPAALPPAFPREIVIPPRRGAVALAIELPAAQPKAPAKPRAAPKRRKKPAQRRRKAAIKPRAAPPPVIALPHLPEPLTQQASEPAIDLAAWSALAPVPEPVSEPLPRARALAVPRGEGLLGALADWLGSQARLLWRKLGSARPARRRFRPQTPLRSARREGDELARLKAENEHLRGQLEALLALQSGAGGNRATSPA